MKDSTLQPIQPGPTPVISMSLVPTGGRSSRLHDECGELMPLKTLIAMVEAGVEIGMAPLLGPGDRFHGKSGFGASAPWKHLAEEFGFTPERIAEYNAQHRALFVAIESRDTQGAVDIMTRHLEKARADLLGVA